MPARTRTAASALAALALLLATPALPAAAAGSDQLVSLGGDGSGTSITVPILGTAVVAPGDARAETLKVRNDGPSAAVLTVEIVDVDLTAPDPFYDDFLINNMPASGLEGASTTIFEGRVEAGGTVSVPVSYEFPVESVEGNGAELEVSFDLLLTMSGEADDLPGTGWVPDATVIVALLSLLAGLGVVIAGRRRVRPEHHG